MFDDIQVLYSSYLKTRSELTKRNILQQLPAAIKNYSQRPKLDGKEDYYMREVFEDHAQKLQLLLYIQDQLTE